jgi:hypothetical protein
MGRYVAPDKGVKETVIGGVKYNPDKSGIYNVESKRHGDLMKREGYFEASLNPYSEGDQQRGFTCVQCGFNGWFRKCGRCGHEAESPIARDGE